MWTVVAPTCKKKGPGEIRGLSWLESELLAHSVELDVGDARTTCLIENKVDCGDGVCREDSPVAGSVQRGLEVDRDVGPNVVGVAAVEVCLSVRRDDIEPRSSSSARSGDIELGCCEMAQAADGGSGREIVRCGGILAERERAACEGRGRSSGSVVCTTAGESVGCCDRIPACCGAAGIGPWRDGEVKRRRSRCSRRRSCGRR